MSDIKSRIANARKNLPELRQHNNSENANEIILVEGPSNSIVDKLSRHRQNEIPDDKKEKDDIFKWVKIKEKMMIDMEHKRDEEWKSQTLNDKLEEEEVDELFENDSEDEEIADTKEDVEDVKLNNDDSDMDSYEGDKVDSNDDESKLKNEYIDQTSEDDDSDQSDDELFSSTKAKPKIIDEEDKSDLDLKDGDDEKEEDNQTTDHFDQNVDNFAFPISYSQNEDKFFVSQNLPLTPLYAEKESTNTLSYDSTDTNASQNFDSQLLANMCSGQFNDFSTQNEKADSQDKENVIISNISDDDEEVNENKNFAKIKPKPKHNINQFIEDEAELSGSDGEVSSDENDEEDLDELEHDEIHEELPSDDELRGQVEKIYNKDILDEDKRQLMILKEMFFDDGDLHDEDGDRKKKFRWQLNNEMDDFINVLSDSDEEDNNSIPSDDDEDQDKVIRLKKETSIVKHEINVGSSSENGEISITKSVTLKSTTQLLRQTQMNKKQNSKISSFFIKDSRLKEILKKRPADFNDNSSKKLKTQDSTSIFDVINC